MHISERLVNTYNIQVPTLEKLISMRTVPNSAKTFKVSSIWKLVNYLVNTLFSHQTSETQTTTESVKGDTFISSNAWNKVCIIFNKLRFLGRYGHTSSLPLYLIALPILKWKTGLGTKNFLAEIKSRTFISFWGYQQQGYTIPQDCTKEDTP